MELHQLKIFNEVALMESYTKAAERLHISQPALSMQVKKLEQTLDMKLFDKTGNKIALNLNGKILYQYTTQIFELVEQAEHELMNQKGFVGGELNIGGSNTPGTYMLPKIIGQFKNLYPLVKVDLHISNTDDIGKWVEDGKLDFAVNGGDMQYNHNIVVKHLMRDQLVIAASPQNKLSQKSNLKPEDFCEQELIVHETNSQLYKCVLRFAHELGIEGRITNSLGNIGSIKQAVAANLGISLIPRAAVALELKLGLICSLKMKGFELSYQYCLIHNENKYISPAGKLLMKYIEHMIKDTDNSVRV